MQPEARVKAFIADFHQTHSQFKAQKSKKAADEFERWEQLVSVLDDAHFIDQAGMELAGSIGGSPAHTLEKERIVSITRSGERVIVETHVADPMDEYYEYELREVQPGDWKIERLTVFLDAADAPFLEYEDDKEKFENIKIHPLRQLPAEEASRDLNKLFTPGTSLEHERAQSSIEVRNVGMLNVTTGTLVVGDLGYGPEVLSPVGQRVPPGSYTAEVAVAFGRNAALRVRFSDETVAAWHPADMGEGGHVVGVDAANVAVMDLAAIMTLKARSKARAVVEYVRGRVELPASRMMSLMEANDTVIADSGWGDGSYPVYWGVDASGKLAVLMIDFRLCPL